MTPRDFAASGGSLALLLAHLVLCLVFALIDSLVDRRGHGGIDGLCGPAEPGRNALGRG